MNELLKSDEYIDENNKQENGEDTILSESYTLYLTFLMGTETFGIPVSSVKEVMEYHQVYKTPRVPSHIRGVINLRGEVVPVIDLEYRFYSSVNSINNTTAIVIVEVIDDNELMHIGVLIDAVKEVTNIKNSDIDQVPEIGAKIRSEFISGIGKKDNQFITLLNISSILNIEELSNY